MQVDVTVVPVTTDTDEVLPATVVTFEVTSSKSSFKRTANEPAIEVVAALTEEPRLATAVDAAVEMELDVTVSDRDAVAA